MGKSQFQYGKGRRSLTDTPSGGYSEKWYQKLDFLADPKKNQPKEIRLVGGVFTIFQHFVRFKRKDGSKGGFYVVCPNWDWENGAFLKGPAATCPLCMDFQNEDLPQELRMLGSHRHYSDAFDVTAAKNGSQDVFGVIYTNKYGMNDLKTISEIAGTPIDDLSKGFTVHWNFDENAKDPKDRTRFYQGKPLPVEWDEDREVFLLKKKFVGNPTDFSGIIDVPDSAEIRSDLKRLGLYNMLEEALEALGRHIETPASSGRSAPRRSSAQSDSSWDEDAPASRKTKPKPPVEDESWGDDVDEAPAPRKTKPKPPVEDESWGDDVDDAPVVTPKRGGKKGTVSKVAPVPEKGDTDWEDGSEEDSDDSGWDDSPVDSDDNWGDEPETPKKKSPGKKTGKKSVAPVAEVEDEEEGEDDGW